MASVIFELVELCAGDREKARDLYNRLCAERDAHYQKHLDGLAVDEPARAAEVAVWQRVLDRARDGEAMTAVMHDELDSRRER